MPASTRILGAWRYAPPAEQLGPVIDLVFADGALRRTVNGRHEVELTYSIAEEGGDHVVLDVDGSGAIRRSREHWRLRDDDALIHEAAPGVVYVRVAPADVAAPAPGVAPVMGEGSSGP